MVRAHSDGQKQNNLGSDIMNISVNNEPVTRNTHIYVTYEEGGKWHKLPNDSFEEFIGDLVYNRCNKFFAAIIKGIRFDLVLENKFPGQYPPTFVTAERMKRIEEVAL